LIRQSKYGFAPRAYPQQESRVSIFEPTQGFDGGQSPQELHAGFTPFSQNWEHEGGYIQPRSGFSRYDATYALGDAGLFGMEAFDMDGYRHGLIASSKTLGYLPPQSVTFSNLSWVAATGASTQTSDADIETGWDGASVYEPARDQNIIVLTNNRQLPKFLTVDDSTTTYSDFTWCASQFSTARAVAAFDNRLVFFNVASTLTTYPTRVFWTPRGNPIDLTIANGAGFEDLMDMRGSGLKVVADRDSIVLFTDEQIWRGRKRGDVYAFDFYVVNQQMGCPFPKTIHKTPHGIGFLGRDLELYLLRGDETVPLGPTGRKPSEVGDHSRIQLYLQRNLTNGDLAHACYDTEKNRSLLFFTSNETNTNLYPQKRLEYKYDNRSFFLSSTSHDWSAAFEMRDVEEAVTWDSVANTWDSYNVQWDRAGLSAPSRRVVVVSSNGTPYRFRSDQTSDDGSVIDCRWRSHALGQNDAFRHETLYEVWLDYNSDSTTTIAVHTSPNVGSTWDSSFTRALSASSVAAEMFPVFSTGQAPLFEVRVNDGSVPKISRMQVRLRDAGLWSGRR
jgi:hypothetical protein